MINTIFQLADISPSVMLDKPFLAYSSSGETSEKDQHIGQRRFTETNFNKWSDSSNVTKNPHLFMKQKWATSP